MSLVGLKGLLGKGGGVKQADRSRNSFFLSLRIAGIYAAAGLCWIIFSDWLLHVVIEEKGQVTIFQNVKGLAFILMTALVIFLLVFLRHRRQRELEDSLHSREETLAAMLREKENLLKELHHRVKNNLQIINSLLSLQNDSIRNPEDRKIMLRGQNRVKALALLHEEPFHQQETSSADLVAFFKTLIGELHPNLESFLLLEFPKDGPRVCVPLDLAIPLGLLINEVLQNLRVGTQTDVPMSLKVTLSRPPEGILFLAILWEGMRLDQESDEGRFGLVLLEVLGSQLKATWGLDESRSRITFAF